jgi:hypothetical protein
VERARPSRHWWSRTFHSEVSASFAQKREHRGLAGIGRARGCRRRAADASGGIRMRVHAPARRGLLAARLNESCGLGALIRTSSATFPDVYALGRSSPTRALARARFHLPCPPALHARASAPLRYAELAPDIEPVPVQGPTFVMNDADWGTWGLSTAPTTSPPAPPPAAGRRRGQLADRPHGRRHGQPWLRHRRHRRLGLQQRLGPTRTDPEPRGGRGGALVARHARAPRPGPALDRAARAPRSRRRDAVRVERVCARRAARARATPGGRARRFYLRRARTSCAPRIRNAPRTSCPRTLSGARSRAAPCPTRPCRRARCCPRPRCAPARESTAPRRRSSRTTSTCVGSRRRARRSGHRSRARRVRPGWTRRSHTSSRCAVCARRSLGSRALPAVVPRAALPALVAYQRGAPPPRQNAEEVV